MTHSIFIDKRKAVNCLMTVAFLFLTACKGMPTHQAYEGPPRADSEVATLIIPGEFNLLAVDGTEYSKIIFADGAVVKMLPGSHQIIFKYQGFWDISGDEHERVETKPISITITVQAGGQYKIDSKKLENIEQARLFSKNPKVSTINMENGQVIPAEIRYNLYGKSLFAEIFGSKQIEPAQPTGQDSPQQATPGTIVSPATSLAVSPAPPIINGADNKNEPASKPENQMHDNRALEMLKYWWEKADKEQQDHFRHWLIK